MIVGYNLTDAGREWFQQIRRIAEAHDYCDMTATVLHTRENAFVQPVEFSFREMGSHITGVIAGREKPFKVDFETRNAEELMTQIAAQFSMKAEFYPHREVWRFIALKQ